MADQKRITITRRALLRTIGGTVIAAAVATALATRARSDGALDGIAVDPLTFSCTFSSIGIEARFSEAAGRTANLFSVEYRQSGTSDWLAALPLEPTRPVNGQPVAARGSIMFCDAGTRYDVRVTVTSGEAQTTLTGVATTRAETIPPAATLVPTHFVRLDGSDSNAGTSNTAGGAWRTLKKAHMSAPAGAVVQVGSGEADEFFAEPVVSTSVNATRSLPITWIAPFPAVDDNRNVINVQKRTFIEGSIRAAPVGQAAAGIPTAPWAPVTLTGPLTGAQLTVWKWSGGNPTSQSVASLGYGRDRTEEYLRLHRWAADTALLSSPEAWAEMMLGGLQATWHSGFFHAGADIYASLPGGQDPNDFWWAGGLGPGFAINAPDSRVTGFVIRNLLVGIRSGPGADRLVVDHNDMRMVTTGIRSSGAIPDRYSVDSVMQYCLVRDRGLRSLDQGTNPSCPWSFVKQRLLLTPLGVSRLPVEMQFTGLYGLAKNRQFYMQTRVGGLQEGTGYLNTGARRSVTRYNTFSGLFNGVGAENVGNPANEDVYMSAEADVHDNLFVDIADDATEPARSASNWRVWNNVMRYCITVMSTGGPSAYGPLYYVRNSVWRVGLAGLTLNEDGVRDGAAEGLHFKYDGSANATTLPQARIYVVNNTFWSDDPYSTAGSPAAGEGSWPEAFTWRNNIVRVGADITDFFRDAKARWDEDYNVWVTASPEGGFFALGAQNTRHTTLDEYRSVSGQGAHSNATIPDIRDTTTLDAQFMDPPGGDLRLKPDSRLRAMGVTVPNLSPGAAPDLGASG